MLCTHCQTPNPDGAPTCLQCHQNLDESGATLAPSGAAGLTATPTIAPARTTPLRAPSGPGLSRRTPSSSLASFSGPSTLPEGFEIGHRYRVAKLLGRGGMGAVYRCHDLELDRDVALKLIRPEIAEDPATLDRFRREIQLSSRVTHRNVLRVYDLGEVEGIRFLTMQYVDGDDLASLIKREGRLPLPRVLSIFGEICKGLSAAHEQGVVHRDLKPQNIMLDAAGTAYVTDFGLAKSLAGTGLTETGSDPRDALLHVPGAGQGREGRSGLGHLLARRDPLRDGDGRRALHGRLGLPGHDAAAVAQAEAGLGAEPGGSGVPPEDHRALPGPGPGRALPERG